MPTTGSESSAGAAVVAAHRCSQDTTGEYPSPRATRRQATACSLGMPRFSGEWASNRCVASGPESARCHRCHIANDSRARALLSGDGTSSGRGLGDRATHGTEEVGRTGRSSSDARRDRRPVLFAVEDDEPTPGAAARRRQRRRVRRPTASRSCRSPSCAVVERVPWPRDPRRRPPRWPWRRRRAESCARDRRLHGVPVLMCTAASDAAGEIGAWVPVVSKPFDLGEIERILDAVAQRRDTPIHGAAG